jgi:membrane-bound lytic murein transglycosylase B
VRRADAIVSRGRARKATSPDLYAGLEQAYGVPSGGLPAIHGMETGFGNFMADSNVGSAIATLSYDCRRSAFFTGHLIAALIQVDQGTIPCKPWGPSMAAIPGSGPELCRPAAWTAMATAGWIWPI